MPPQKKLLPFASCCFQETNGRNKNNNINNHRIKTKKTTKMMMLKKTKKKMKKKKNKSKNKKKTKLWRAMSPRSRSNCQRQLLERVANSSAILVRKLFDLIKH